MKLRRAVPLALVVLAFWRVPADAQRSVAITLDDLPYAGRSLEDARRATDALLAALTAHEVAADAFVQGNRVEVAGETEPRRGLIRSWRDAGHALHNHSYSHLRYSETEVDAYLADVSRGHVLVEDVLAETPGARRVRFFRPPFNDLGETAATRDALHRSLGERRVRLAPFTVEHGDWMFNTVYERALDRGDSALARRVGEAYLTQLDTAFEFAEHLAVETFGREIPQVFLIHANRINADYLDTMLARLRERGYEFVSLDEATSDPAYATADEYLARWGVSWLHRWRVALGLPNALRHEPEPPSWVVDGANGELPSVVPNKDGRIPVSAEVGRYVAYDDPVIALVDVDVIDGTAGDVRRNHTVVIDGDRIAVVGPANSVRIPDAARSASDKPEPRSGNA